MNQILWRCGALGASLLVSAPAAQAQQPAPASPTAAELKKSLARIERGTEGESVAFDQLVAATDKKLVAYLKAHEVSAAAAKSLGLGYVASPDSARLKVFSYTYSSGGTRGTITQAVLQWHNQAGQRFAYVAHDEGSFEEIYRLPSPGRTQYLLLGSEPGSSICVRGLAWLVELKGNYLLLDKQALDNQPRLDICNVALRYDARRRTLVAAADSTFGEPDVYADKPFEPFTLHFAQGRFTRKK
jgi:hypothetical protein